MNFFTAIRHLTVTTPIPSSSVSSFTPAPYVQALHNHSSLISLAPLVSSTTPVAVPASMLKSVSTPDSDSVDIHADMDCFEVIEDVGITGKFKMLIAFHDVEDGTGCVLEAPMGMRVDSWVKVGRSEGAGKDGWELKEQVKLQVNWFLLPMVARNVVNARKAVHEGVIRLVEKKGLTAGVVS